MTLKEAIEVLEYYNDWRRGFVDVMPNPTTIGQALEVVIKHYNDVIGI